jgi:hypothetical protein
MLLYGTIGLGLAVGAVGGVAYNHYDKKQTEIRLTQNAIINATIDSRKYDIMQLAYVRDREFKSPQIFCTVFPDRSNKEVSQAYILNGTTDEGYLYQLGIAIDVSSKLFGKSFFNLNYSIADPDGNFAYNENLADYMLDPNRPYRIGLVLDKGNVMAEVMDLTDKSKREIVLPNFIDGIFTGHTFVGGLHPAGGNKLSFTGVLKETMAPKQWENVGGGKFVLSEGEGMPSGLNSYSMMISIQDSERFLDPEHKKLQFYGVFKIPRIEAKKQYTFGNYRIQINPVVANTSDGNKKELEIVTSSTN